MKVKLLDRTFSSLDEVSISNQFPADDFLDSFSDKLSFHNTKENTRYCSHVPVYKSRQIMSDYARKSKRERRYLSGLPVTPQRNNYDTIVRRNDSFRRRKYLKENLARRHVTWNGSVQRRSQSPAQRIYAPKYKDSRSTVYRNALHAKRWPEDFLPERRNTPDYSQEKIDNEEEYMYVKLYKKDLPAFRSITKIDDNSSVYDVMQRDENQPSLPNSLPQPGIFTSKKSNVEKKVSNYRFPSLPIPPSERGRLVLNELNNDYSPGSKYNMEYYDHSGELGNNNKSFEYNGVKEGWVLNGSALDESREAFIDNCMELEKSERMYADVKQNEISAHDNGGFENENNLRGMQNRLYKEYAETESDVTRSGNGGGLDGEDFRMHGSIEDTRRDMLRKDELLLIEKRDDKESLGDGKNSHSESLAQDHVFKEKGELTEEEIVSSHHILLTEASPGEFNGSTLLAEDSFMERLSSSGSPINDRTAKASFSSMVANSNASSASTHGKQESTIENMDESLKHLNGESKALEIVAGSNMSSSSVASGLHAGSKYSASASNATAVKMEAESNSAVTSMANDANAPLQSHKGRSNAALESWASVPKVTSERSEVSEKKDALLPVAEQRRSSENGAEPHDSMGMFSSRDDFTLDTDDLTNATNIAYNDSDVEVQKDEICPWGRTLACGRKENKEEYKDRIFENTIFPTPTYSAFETKKDTEFCLSKVEEDWDSLFVNRCFEYNSTNCGAYVKVQCCDCHKFVSMDCGDRCKQIREEMPGKKVKKKRPNKKEKTKKQKNKKEKKKKK